MVSRKSVELSAGEFSYVEAGEGSPLLFLHALGRSATDWLDVIEALKGDWRCIALDQRGHGVSVRTDRYLYEMLEDDFREFVDTLGLDRFSLVAHSMGGVVGLLFAERTPDRLLSFVLEDTTVPLDRHEYPSVPSRPSETVDYDWEARRQLYKELASPDPSWRSDLSRITARTLLVAGAQEARDVEETAALLPDAHVVRIEAGHWIHETELERFLAVVMEFLDR